MSITTFNVNAVDCWICPTVRIQDNLIDEPAPDGFMPIPVAIVLPDGKMRRFSSAKAAELATGIGRKCIRKAARGVTATAGGFKWTYQTN